MDTTLSFECGRRLAVIKGGKLNNNCVYLLDKRKKCCNNCNKKCKGDCCDDCFGCGNIKIEEEIDHIIIPEKDKGIFQQLPNNEKSQSDVLMINGRRGCGKSWYMSDFLKHYIKCFPKQKIFLFSQCKNDELLTDLVSKQIDLEEFNEDGLDIEDFPDDCCVCFDDIDMLNDDKPEKLKTKVFAIMNSLIQLSRKRNITVVQTSHITTNHGETKHALNGCSSFTFFLNAVSHQIRNALKIYMGLSANNIKKILSLKNSRYCTIFTTSPMVCMTEKEIFIIKD